LGDVASDIVGDAAVWKIRLMVRFEPPSVKQWVSAKTKIALRLLDSFLW
jgi:DNA-binding transcriptional regulator YdaS (Cro superfamily)